ncbi:MAG: hypothetical protein OEX83_00905 [Gammaproteobacteria bacterium]|nr:hypothetical protein [Gammaproteobacteria bacterium]
MAEIPDIKPLHPGWPVRPVDKSGERQKETDSKKKKKKKTDNKRGDGETSGFDEFA